MTVMVSTKQTSHVLPIQRYRVTTTMCKDAPPHRVPQVPGPNHSPSPAKGHTHTFLEGALQSPDYQVFCPNALFFHKLGVTGADTVAAEVHGGLHGHHALHHSLQLPAQAGMQGVGSQDSCSWTTMPIKQCPVMACEELHRKGLVSGSAWLPQPSPSQAGGTKGRNSSVQSWPQSRPRPTRGLRPVVLTSSGHKFSHS